MRLEFNKRWRSFRPNDIGDMPDGAANVLIRRGIAGEYIEPEPVEHKPKQRRKPREKAAIE